jgi:hypothetical protein
MKDRLRLALSFDPVALRRNLSLLGQTIWIDHFVKQNYEGNWSVIPLRAPEGAEHPVMMIYSDPSCTVFVDTPYLQQCPYFQEVLASFQCPLDAVRLMKLTPGSVIKEHKDYDLSFEDGKARLHIPVTSNSEVEFYLNDKQVILNEGECWYLRLSDPHWVANRGKTDRIHLVIDATVNPWLQQLFARSKTRSL